MIVVSFICCIQPAVRHHCRGRVGKRQDILRIETRHHIVLAVKDREVFRPAYLHGRLVIRKLYGGSHLYIPYDRVGSPLATAQPYDEGRVVVRVPGERGYPAAEREGQAVPGRILFPVAFLYVRAHQRLYAGIRETRLAQSVFAHRRKIRCRRIVAVNESHYEVVYGLEG